MDQRQAFLRDILDNPDDDAPRLVFADWLEENDPAYGEHRAEFIRLQCRLARGGLDPKERRRLRGRERSLLDKYRWVWLHDEMGNRGRVAFSFGRGFVESAVLSVKQFLREGTAIFHRAPVRRLDLFTPGTLGTFATLGRSEWARLARHPALARLSHLTLALAFLDREGAATLAASDHIGGIQSLTIRVEAFSQGAATPLRQRLGRRFRLTRQPG